MTTAEFIKVNCPECGRFVLRGLLFRGLVQERCDGCRKRLWIQGTGKEIKVIRIDKAPARVT